MYSDLDSQLHGSQNQTFTQGPQQSTPAGDLSQMLFQGYLANLHRTSSSGPIPPPPQIPHAREQSRFDHATDSPYTSAPHGTAPAQPYSMGPGSFAEDPTTVLQVSHAGEQQAMAIAIPPPPHDVSHGTYGYPPTGEAFADYPTTSIQPPQVAQEPHYDNRFMSAQQTLARPIRPSALQNTSAAPQHDYPPAGGVAEGPTVTQSSSSLAYLMIVPVTNTPGQPIGLSLDDIARAPAHPVNILFPPTAQTHSGSHMAIRTATSSSRVSPYPSAGSSPLSLTPAVSEGHGDSSEGSGLQVGSRRRSRGSRGRPSQAGSQGGQGSRAASRGGQARGSNLGTGPSIIQTDVPALLQEMRAQVCLISMLDGPPYPNPEEKATLYRYVQFRSQVQCNIDGEWIAYVVHYPSLMGQRTPRDRVRLD